jgi:hypothetical protein
MTVPALPYGPETPAIRRFLVRLAGLGGADRRAIVSAWERHSASPAYTVAEAALALVIERSGRESARDALSGPLLQLVRSPAHRDGASDATSAVASNDASDTEALDPVAEPALAALLALLVRDLLDPAAFEALYAACADHIPLDDVLGTRAR